MHLLIDGYGSSLHRLQDRDFLQKFLEDYPDSLGMTKISKPTILEYAAPKPEDSGLSGFVVIAESHISVHTFPARNYIWLDIFSCKEFDPNVALNEIRDIFSLTSVNSWALERGLDHYSPEEARRALDQERIQLTSRAT